MRYQARCIIHRLRTHTNNLSITVFLRQDDIFSIYAIGLVALSNTRLKGIIGLGSPENVRRIEPSESPVFGSVGKMGGKGPIAIDNRRRHLFLGLRSNYHAVFQTIEDTPEQVLLVQCGVEFFFHLYNIFDRNREKCCMPHDSLP